MVKGLCCHALENGFEYHGPWEELGGPRDHQKVMETYWIIEGVKSAYNKKGIWFQSIISRFSKIVKRHIVPV